MSKISDWTVATSVGYTDLVPIVQSGTDKQVPGGMIAPWSDSTGTALVRPDGSTIGVGASVVLQSGTSAAIASANEIAINAALIAGGAVRLSGLGDYYINESLLMPSDSALYLDAGIVLKLLSASNRVMVRSSNARMAYDGNAVAMIGVQILYADTASASGTGTLTYTNSGTTLKWQAPGDSAGTPVDISAAGFFMLPSGTAGKALYVIAPTALSRPSADKTCGVYVSTIKGAVSCSAVVASNVATITETSHGREVGDMLEIYRPSSGRSVVSEIASVTNTNVYTVAWTVTDFASEAVVVNGTRNISIYGPGVLDGNWANQTNLGTIEKYPLYLRNVSKYRIKDLTIRNASRSASICQSSDGIVRNIFGNNVGVLFQWEGATSRAKVSGITSYSSDADDILALSVTNVAVDTAYSFTGSDYIGNITDIDIDGVISEGGHNCALKITGYTGCTFDGITVRGIRGYGTNPAIMAVDDVASLVGASLKSIMVEGCSWRVVGGTVGEVINFTMSGGATSIKINNSDWNGTGVVGIRLSAASGTIANLETSNIVSNNSPTGSWISCTQTVDNISLNGCNFVLGSGANVFNATSSTCSVTSISVNGGSWSGNSGAYGIHHSDGLIFNVFYSNLYAGDIRNIYESESTADNSPRISINGVHQQGTATGVTLKSAGATLNVGNWSAGSLGNNLIQDNTGTTLTSLNAGTINTTSNLFLGNGTARTVKGLNFTQSPSFSATPTWRISNGNIISPGALTAAITAITLQDIPPAGQSGAFIFTQGGAGNFAITAPATWKFPTAAFVTGGAAATGTKTVLNWVSDGTNLVMQGTNAWV